MTAESCNIQTIFDNPFEPRPFENTASIRFWHVHSARYGNSNNITMLISGSQSDAEEYLRGLLASSITIFSLAVLWCLVLVGFKCLGPYGVGWLSGKHVPLPPKPLEEAFAKEEEFQEASTTWEQRYKKLLLSRKIMKGFVVVAGLGIVASAIMLSVKGVDSLIQTLDGADTVINEATRLMKEGVILIDSVIYSQDQLVIDTKDAWDAINEMCPQVREPVCTNITDVASCNFQGIIENTEGMTEFLSFIANTRSLVIDQLNDSRNDLIESIEFANSIGDISETFQWAFWCSLAFSLATAVLSLFFVFRAIWPPTKSSRCSCRNIFVIPCFVLFVTLSWIFAIVFVIGSVGLADMCFNSPDENMKALLSRMQDFFSPLIYKSIIFYISGCPVNLIAPEAVDFLKFLVIFFESIQGAMQDLDGQFISDVCGQESGNSALQATELVSSTVCGAADLVKALYVYLECSNWFPLYEEGVYNSMCYEGASGFSWVTSTQIAIVVCSMIILTLRVVFQDIVVSEPTTALVTEPNMENQDVIGGEQSDHPDETSSNAYDAQTTSLDGSKAPNDQAFFERDDSTHDNAPVEDQFHRDDDTVASEDIYLESSKDEPK